jgi:hypothetical protein
MLDETSILAFFIRKDRINDFFSFMEKNYGIKKERMYVYRIEGNELEIFLTFKFNRYERIKYTREWGKPVHVHIKNNSVFTINALNMYIETLNGNIDPGNFDHRQIKIDWEKLRNTLLMSVNGELKTEKIYKIKNY